MMIYNSTLIDVHNIYIHWLFTLSIYYPPIIQYNAFSRTTPRLGPTCDVIQMIATPQHSTHTVINTRNQRSILQLLLTNYAAKRHSGKVDTCYGST